MTDNTKNPEGSFHPQTLTESVPEKETSESNKVSDNEENRKTLELADSLVPSVENVSKKQLRRLHRRENFLKNRQKKRELEKIRKKEKRKAMRDAGQPIPTKAPTKCMKDSSCSLRVSIDMSFEHVMNERDICRTFAQLCFCYATNRRMKNPVQLSIVNMNGKQAQLFYSNSCRHNWDVRIEEKTLGEVFDKKDIVYLTSDSTNVLKDLDDKKVYVIGGLIDHNSQKGLCLKIAEENGYDHARLPIDEFVKMSSRKVLTVNQVFDIIAVYTEVGKWEESFSKVIPKRKNPELLKNGVKRKSPGLPEEGGKKRNLELSEDERTREKSESPLC
ncbi:hypothetical protein AB6A40_002958 [Gnathostoma spinigerum]|uniref:tRNA (guanine(9)-N(1))-methyltransferase n=1 Tax=Gnathostoma spinigerum TaxID=75299 RepID=A0ABD6EFX7_9BILA